MFKLTILGNSAATPAYYRHPTAQILHLQNTNILIDCGEGTQMQLQRYRIKLGKIAHIFISHLHGDHYLGLVGLISTMHLQKREDDLYIYGPRDLAEIIRMHLKYGNTRLNYPIHFKEISPDCPCLIFEDEQITVETFLMDHRIQCTGFLFKEKPKRRKILVKKLPENIPLNWIISLKNGEDILDEKGKLLYKNEDCTYRPKSRIFAHCSDTKYSEEILPFIENADLMYHESTFLQADLDKAEETYHSTALQAATVALKAKVNKLLIGHFSSRYRYLEPFLEEARSIFQNTYLANEGETFAID